MIIIEEGPFHIGWYKKINITEDYYVRVHSFDIYKGPNPSREWGGFLISRTNKSADLTAILQSFKEVNEMVRFVTEQVSDYESQKMFVVKESDIEYVIEIIERLFTSRTIIP